MKLDPENKIIKNTHTEVLFSTYLKLSMIKTHKKFWFERVEIQTDL